MGLLKSQLAVSTSSFFLAGLGVALATNYRWISKKWGN